MIIGKNRMALSCDLRGEETEHRDRKIDVLTDSRLVTGRVGGVLSRRGGRDLAEQKEPIGVAGSWIISV